MLIFVLDSINTLFNLFLQFYYSDFQFGKEKKKHKIGSCDADHFLSFVLTLIK